MHTMKLPKHHMDVCSSVVVNFPNHKLKRSHRTPRHVGQGDTPTNAPISPILIITTPPSSQRQRPNSKAELLPRGSHKRADHMESARHQKTISSTYVHRVRRSTRPNAQARPRPSSKILSFFFLLASTEEFSSHDNHRMVPKNQVGSALGPFELQGHGQSSREARAILVAYYEDVLDAGHRSNVLHRALCSQMDSTLINKTTAIRDFQSWHSDDLQEIAEIGRPGL